MKLTLSLFYLTLSPTITFFLFATIYLLSLCLLFLYLSLFPFPLFPLSLYLILSSLKATLCCAVLTLKPWEQSEHSFISSLTLLHFSKPCILTLYKLCLVKLREYKQILFSFTCNFLNCSFFSQLEFDNSLTLFQCFEKYWVCQFL